MEGSLEDPEPSQKPLSRAHTIGALPAADFRDMKLVPSSLTSIAPILRVANEIEPHNPRVAYLCQYSFPIF
ncbi:hypothetical protein O6H91_11G110000 [Diphasiastrum complanatum]|uniref:Uncharacterized protein n=1 Tax=Diphasiastrum complanatum TaxID=34168 RepID=A0ACC2CCS1_DIPCM|nr:hypothetical protein O6H91_11G110000 [Diphasiastrum complanatum]